LSIIQGGAILLSGVAAGATNTVIGSGTLITFPTLLAIGLPPLTANVSNTIGLCPGSIIGTYGYRRELKGQAQRGVALVGASLVGGATGAVLLLVLPSNAFNAIVPILIGLAVVLVIAGPTLNRRLRRNSGPHPKVAHVLWWGSLLSGVYGGYFGAAQGVLLMGMLGALSDDDIQRHNALKNLMAATVNVVAACVFVVTANPQWGPVGLVAVGSLIGGVIGARFGRRISPRLLRTFIVVVGVLAIVKLIMN
jgi:uncharacterized protein